MHEMAIAQGILDIVLKTAAENKARKVTGVKLLIGQMTQIEPESLTFGFEALAMGSIAEGAHLDITTIPLVGECNSCKQQFSIEKYCFLCPHCNSANIAVVSGRELAVDYLEVE
ncbi:hydrogenase maturation nickel metallochaperone HypA [Pelosinus sp. sgz500959]|uniref:hydrogenase maturation nickel metallochaperone HypA n=1 Tax=Pelosinus sp. sgz500959 TaxID=3242472 RepID=UPI0036718D0F